MIHRGLQIKPDEQLLAASGVSDGDFLSWNDLESSWLPSGLDSEYLKLDGSNSPMTGDLEFTGINVGIDSEKIKISKIGSPTYTNVQHAINLVASTGMTSGGLVTQGAGVTVDVAAGTGWIKATDSDVAEILSFDWDAVASIAIPTNTVRYIMVAYGDPPTAQIATLESDWDLDTSFPLAKVVNESDVLHILNNPWWVGDGVTNIIERLQADGIIVRDNHVGGLQISVPGTRNLAVTTGTLWSRLNEFVVPALDTSVTGTFEIYWRSGASAWTDADVSQYPITQYNRLSDNSLQTINNNWYFNWWIYAEADDTEFSMVYPQGQYATSAGAEAVSPPSSIPTHISESAILIGRIICKQGQDAPVSVQSTFDTTFTASQAADHGNLAGLADDDHSQYLLASDATSRTIFTSGWSDLTDGGETTLHSHAGGSIASNLTLVPGTSDGDYCGIIESGIAGRPLAFGELCYLQASDSRWEQCSSDIEVNSISKLGACILAAAGDGSSTAMLLQGNVRADSLYPTLTIGAPVYIGSLGGTVVVDAPTDSGSFVRIVGHANTANEIYFNPSQNWDELP